MQLEEIQIHELINQLDMFNQLDTIDDTRHAVGQLQDTPFSMKILNHDPAQLLFGFQINSGGREMSSVLKTMDEIPAQIANLSIDAGIAWLTIHDLNGATVEGIQILLRQVVMAIESSDLRLKPGCVKCGSMEKTEIVCTNGQPSRVCSDCITKAIKKKHELESDLNRGRLSTALTLPGACIFVAILWAFFWTCLDFVSELYRVNNDRIDVDHYSQVFLVIAWFAFGCLLGKCIGTTLQNSILLSKAPVTMSILLVPVACSGGEVGYVALQILRQTGVLDFNLAVQMLGPLAKNHSELYVFLKTGLFIVTICSCCYYASMKKSVDLNL